MVWQRPTRSTTSTSMATTAATTYLACHSYSQGLMWEVSKQLSCIVIIKSLLRNLNADVLCLVMMQFSFGIIDTRQHLEHISTERHKKKLKISLCLLVQYLSVWTSMHARQTCDLQKMSPHAVKLIKQSPTCQCVCYQWVETRGHITQTTFPLPTHSKFNQALSVNIGQNRALNLLWFLPPMPHSRLGAHHREAACE